MSQKTDSTTKHDLADLNGFYFDADSCDTEVFAEQRSNLLLVAGEHYNRRQSIFYKRIRDSRELSQEQKLRLTKNHIQNICKQYANNIISMAPGVGFEPKNDSEMQDQKAAELHHAVWRDACDRYSIESEKIDDWVDDFIQIGEVAVKIFWDPTLGKVKAYDQKTDGDGNPMYLDPQGEETGDPAPHPMTGEPQHELAPDQDSPVMEGDFVFEEIYGFNLLRAPQAKKMEESPYLILRKMSDKKSLQKQFPDFADKITETSEDTYIVFDGVRGGYKKTKDLVMLREFYFRPGIEYPNGFFYFATKDVVLASGELPGGIFPIVYQAFDKFQTTPRGRSPVKQMRPYQVEINRAASKIAEHQITLGDDKLLVQNGSKVSTGTSLPGVRTVSYTGAAPEILAGRDGSQYLTYMQSQIEELYRVMNVAEDSMEKEMQLEPYSLLYRAASQKKKFQRYIKRFENFLIHVCQTYLSLAKIHMPDDRVIYAIGRSEQVNLAEFKSATDICYQIKVEAQSDDVETKLGQQLAMNHVLQYVGPQLKSEDIGKIMRNMPYVNFEGSFDDMTIDYDTAENDLLALDRGETPPIHPYDNHVYQVKRLSSRMRKADFKYLPPMVQQNYAAKIQVHEQMEAQNQLQIQRATQGYIPTGGYMVACDFYVNDPNDPEKTRRARFPYEALQWLAKSLESQGQGLQQLESMNQGAQAQIAGMVSQGHMQGGTTPPPNGGSSVMPRPGMGHYRGPTPMGPAQQPPMQGPNGMGPRPGMGGQGMPPGVR